MLLRDMESLDCNSNSTKSTPTPTPTPWSYQTNWIIAHGSLQSSLAVESSDDPIAEPDPEYTPTKSPLILKPRCPDSGPCEIKICFKQKNEVGQIYVRSTARSYEIYYTNSPHSINEYLSTVRCGVAERDDQVLQTSSVEDVAEEHGECLSGDMIAETASNGGSTVSGEDEWVKIKVPGAGSSPASDKIGTNGVNNIQDLYEATAQISDLDPCLSLTIRLLSLQDKGYVYVDEIYVFVDPVQSTDSGNEAVLAGSSAQSSLVAMFMPTLLQLSKSSASRGLDKYAADEVLKNGKMETTPTVIDKIDSPQQFVKSKELGKDTAESAELQQPTSAKNSVETKNANNFQAGHLEIAMEQLISRLSRVEDICLSFEEKMLKPIERIEARLQQVEHQLEKLAKSSHDFGLPHCTRISAPEFSCSESNSSSFYNNEVEKKDFACDNMPDLSHEANFHPGLIISAPEFSYDEGDEDDDNLETLKDSPHLKPRKTLSVDDALAAALNGFLSNAINPSELIQTPVSLTGDVNEEIHCEGHAESCQIETREVPATENENREPSQYARVLTVKAPDFTAEETCSEEQLNFAQSTLDMVSIIETREFPATENENREPSQYAQVLTVEAPAFSAEETGCEEQLNFTQSTLDMGSVTENEKSHDNEMIPPSIESNSLFKSAGSCGFGRNERTNEFDSASNGDSPAVSVMGSRTCLANGHLNGSSIVNMIETYFDGDTSGGPADISNGSAANSAKDSRDTSSIHQISQETNLGKFTCRKPDDASEEVLGHEAETVSEDQSFEDDAEHVPEPSHVAFLDLEFPILEVKFTSDVHMSSKSALEALLDGAAESNSEASSIIAKEIDDVSTNGNETTDLLSTDGLLVDLGVCAADASSDLECTGSSAQIFSQCVYLEELMMWIK